MKEALAVTVTSLGEGRESVSLAPVEATVGVAIQRTSFHIDGKRIALNGSGTGLGDGVMEGDRISIAPRVQGG